MRQSAHGGWFDATATVEPVREWRGKRQGVSWESCRRGILEYTKVADDERASSFRQGQAADPEFEAPYGVTRDALRRRGIILDEIHHDAVAGDGEPANRAGVFGN